MTIDIKIGIGEALDRVSILEIKLDSIEDEVKLRNVKKEYDYLNSVLHPIKELEGTKLLYDSLYEVLDGPSIAAAVLIVAKYQYQSAFVADQEINLLACLTEIMVECEFK